VKNPLYNRVMFVLSFLGVLVAGFLWYKHATHGDIPCGVSGGCEVVANSPYARFPVGTGPYVAMWGTLGYLLLVAATFARTLQTAPKRDALLRGVALAAAAFGTAASLQLTWLEVFKIHAICRWCVASQVIILGVLLTGVAEAVNLAASRRAGGAPPAPPTPIEG
jgi:uncharacterized membrane protein